MKTLGKAFLLILLAFFVYGCTTSSHAEVQSVTLANVFEQTDCPVAPLRNLDQSSYSGPIIDTHIHIPSIPDGPVGFADEHDSRPALGANVRISDYVCMMEYENTSMVFAFFPVWDPIVDESLAVVLKTMEEYPGQFVPFIMPPDHDDRPDGYPTVAADELSKMLSAHPGMFKGYGEIGLYARGDHGGPKGAPELPPDSERLLEIYTMVRAHKLLVYFHLGEGQADAFEKILDANPDINFIWHGDQLIKGSGRDQDLVVIDGILSRHPNAYYGIDELYGDVWLLRPEVSKDEFLAHFKDPESLLDQDVDTWKGFIESHPDQVLWGTDRGWSSPWSLDPEVGLTLNTYARAFIGRLDPAVQERFAYKNAQRLLNTTG